MNQKLVNEILKKCVENDIRLGTEDAMLNTSLADELQSWGNLPDENLSNILRMDFSQYSTFEALEDAAGRLGYFRFKPYIIKDAPALVLRHNRILIYAGGGRFQVSGTVGGDGDYGRSSICVRELIDDAGYYYDDNKKWYQTLLSMCVLNTAGALRPFQYILKDNDDILYKFIGAITKSLLIPYDDTFCLSDVITKTHHTGYYNNDYLVVTNKGLDICYVYFSEVGLCVTTKEGRFTTDYVLPLGDFLNLEQGSDFQAYVAKHLEDVLLLLVCGLMDYAGVHINWVICYGARKLEPLRKPNVRTRIELKNLHQVSDYVKTNIIK